MESGTYPCTGYLCWKFPKILEIHHPLQQNASIKGSDVVWKEAYSLENQYVRLTIKTTDLKGLHRIDFRSFKQKAKQKM